MDEEKINRLIDAILVMQEQEDTITPALRSQLAETEFSIGNILKAIEQGIFTPSTKQRLDELKTPLQSELLGVGHSGVFLISPVFSMLSRLAWCKVSWTRKSKTHKIRPQNVKSTETEPLLQYPVVKQSSDANYSLGCAIRFCCNSARRRMPSVRQKSGFLRSQPSVCVMWARRSRRVERCR